MRKVAMKMGAALLCTAALTLSVGAGAQDKKGTNFSDKAVEADADGKAVEQLTLGYKLAEYARSSGDAKAMIVAAKMVSAIPVKEGTDKGEIKGAGAKETGKVEAAPTGSALFAEARTLAKGDQDILDEIKDAQGAESKGVTGGAIGTSQYVPGQTVWTVRFTANGGEPLIVGTKRYSYADVDLKIYDENGNLVCQDLSHDQVLACRVNPIWTGAFSVQVVNHGSTGSSVALVTN